MAEDALDDPVVRDGARPHGEGFFFRLMEAEKFRLRQLELPGESPRLRSMRCKRIAPPSTCRMRLTSTFSTARRAMRGIDSASGFPALLQNLATGHSAQRGFFGRQRSAPSSIIA
jgi:hypothetical protein